MKQDSYDLRIRALPHHVAPEQRLKAVLKRLLRTYGFRSVSCVPVKAVELDATKGNIDSKIYAKTNQH